MNRTAPLVSLLLLAAVVPAQEPSAALQLRATSELPVAWGKTFRGAMASKALGTERTFHLYLPPSHAATARRYPTIFVTDGDHYFDEVVTAARQLAMAGHVPECIVVGVSTRQRTQDLTPAGMDAYIAEGAPRGDQLLEFLARELAPELASVRAGRPNVLLGHSHGAILCHHAAAKWRAEFPFVVALDCPMTLSDNWLSRQLQASVEGGGHLRLVSFETRFGWTEDAWRQLVAAAPADWQLTRRRMDGDDHNSMVFEGFFDGLRAVFRDYSGVGLRNASGPEVFQHYAKLAPYYGAPCPPSEQTLNRTLMDLVIRGEREMALHTLRLLRENHGEPMDAEGIERRIENAAAAMQGKPTVEQLRRAPRPSVAAMQPYLGSWRGTIGFEGHRPTNTVTFRVVDGRVEGTVEIDETSEMRQTIPLEYIELTAAGIDFGFMNGMHPRGMLVHTTRRDGDRLVGRIQLRGVHFEPPDGHVPPVYEIDLQRVGVAGR